MSRARCVFCTLFVVTALAACGQSGPLYMPGSPSEMTTIPPGPDDSAEEDADARNTEDGDRE